MAPFASPHETREVAADDRHSALANLKDRQLAVTRAAKWPAATVHLRLAPAGLFNSRPAWADVHRRSPRR